MPKRPASQDLSHDPLLAKKFSHLKLVDHPDFVPTQELALSILENRHLAQYVRHVTLNSQDIVGFPDKAIPFTASTPEEVEKETVFKAAIDEQKWSEEDGTELLKRLMRPSSSWPGPDSYQLFPDAVVALLLPILPNVEKWTVGDIDRPEFVGKALRRAKEGIFGSISVRELELKANTMFGDGRWADYSFPAFKIFKNLENLESMSGKGIGGEGIEDGGFYSEIPRQASAVKEIHLKDCELGGYCLSRIIGFSTGLEAFTYRFGGRAGLGGTTSIYSPGLAKALDPHRLTLRKLDLDIDELIYSSLVGEMSAWKAEIKDEEEAAEEARREVKEDAEDSDDSANTLNSEDSKASADKMGAATSCEPYFPNLTHLRIGIKLVLRFVELSGKNTLAEWLPPTLEELTIVGYEGMNDEQVNEVIQRRDEILPNLKLFIGVEDDFIENGKELEDEDDFVASDAEEDGDSEAEDDEDPVAEDEDEDEDEDEEDNE